LGSWKPGDACVWTTCFGHAVSFQVLPESKASIDGFSTPPFDPFGCTIPS
jgi:hypothetical protein